MTDHLCVRGTLYALSDYPHSEMDKPGTWGDQMEITAFTQIYNRAVRVFSYNYMESRLVHVTTPTENGSAEETSAEKDVWLLHMHGH